MRHLFLVLLSLIFSVSVFSQSANLPVPDNPAAVVVTYDVPDVVPDYSPEVCRLPFAQEFKAADGEFNKVFNFQKVVIMTYSNDFKQTIEALNSGKMVKRQWMKNNTFIFKQVPSTIDKSVIPRMTSLPQSVKDEFERRRNDEYFQLEGDIYYTDQLAIVDNSNVIRGYSPSVEDVFANDWVILD
jgi:hypothetical protein